MKSLSYILFFLLLSVAGKAQADKIFIETKNTALVYLVGKDKKVIQVYIGRRLAREDVAALNSGREIYLTAGMENQFEPAIRAVHADGNPSLDLRFEDYKQVTEHGVVHSQIVLKDPVYPFYVTVHFKAYVEEDVIKTWTEIRHREKKPVMLTQYASSLLHFNAREYWLTQFHGDWAR